MKFRAYHEDGKRMIYSDNIPPKFRFNFGELDIPGEIEYSFEISYGGRPHCRWTHYRDENDEGAVECSSLIDNIMYPTGIKDRDGKDIYTGDVVELEKSTLDEPYTGVVVFKDGAYRLKREIKPGTRSYHDMINVGYNYRLKVLGNVYEDSIFGDYKETYMEEIHNG